MIAYHALDHNNQVKKTRQLPPTSSRYRLPDLQSDTPYWICVLGLAPDDNLDVTSSALQTRSADILKDTPFSKCMKVSWADLCNRYINTMPKSVLLLLIIIRSWPEAKLHGDGFIMAGNLIHVVQLQMRTLGSTDTAISLLHRRLGVVVGACVGVVVFVVLITSLACVKYRKRREHHQQVRKVSHVFDK